MRIFTVTLGVVATLFCLQTAPLSAAEETESVPLDEERINHALQDWLTNHPHLNGGGWQWLPITAPEVVRQTLRENLTLKQQALQIDMAAETQKEIEASLFDTTLSVSGSYSRSKTKDRNEWGNKYKKSTTRCPQRGDNVVLDQFGSLIRVIRPGESGYDATLALVAGDGWICLPEGQADYDQSIFVVYNPSNPVHYLRYDQIRPAGFYLKKEEASEADPKGASQSGTVTFGLNKSFPWGVDLSVNQSVTHKEAEWILNASSNTPLVGSYERPWTASLNASLSLPLPGTRNSGPYSVRDVEVELAALDGQRARSDFQSGEISLIQDAHKAFWEMVRGVRTLHAAIENRQIVERLLKRSQTLFDLRRITSYDLLQVQSEYEQVKNRETLAWNGLVSASNTLNLLQNLPQSVLFLPTAYAGRLSELSSIALGTALDQGERHNPQLSAQAVVTKQADWRLKMGRNQARPDVTLSASASATQSSAVYGFQSLSDAYDHLTRPDAIALSARLAYHYPWGNRSAKANQNQSQEQLAISHLEERRIKNQIDRLIKNGHVTLESAMARVAISERQLRLTQKTYEKALRAQEAGRITAYETVAKGSEVLDVENQWILAQVDAKKAEVDLLAAMGILEASGLSRQVPQGQEVAHE